MACLPIHIKTVNKFFILNVFMVFDSLTIQAIYFVHIFKDAF